MQSLGFLRGADMLIGSTQPLGRVDDDFDEGGRSNAGKWRRPD